MFIRYTCLATILAFGANCSQIDSGGVYNNYSYGMGDASWTVELQSSTGEFAVTFLTDGLTALTCGCDPYILQPGTVATLSGSMGADYGAFGSGTVNGIGSQLGFKGRSSSGEFVETSIQLTSSPFTMGTGTFFVPFTMTGQLEAMDESHNL